MDQGSILTIVGALAGAFATEYVFDQLRKPQHSGEVAVEHPNINKALSQATSSTFEREPQVTDLERPDGREFFEATQDERKMPSFPDPPTLRTIQYNIERASQNATRIINGDDEDSAPTYGISRRRQRENFIRKFRQQHANLRLQRIVRQLQDRKRKNLGPVESAEEGRKDDENRDKDCGKAEDEANEDLEVWVVTKGLRFT